MTTSGEFVAATVSDLRAVCEDLPDDTVIAIESPYSDLGWLRKAWVQASDAYPQPWGTDPMVETTVPVLVLEIGFIEDAVTPPTGRNAE